MSSFYQPPDDFICFITAFGRFFFTNPETMCPYSPKKYELIKKWDKKDNKVKIG